MYTYKCSRCGYTAENSSFHNTTIYDEGIEDYLIVLKCPNCGVSTGEREFDDKLFVSSWTEEKS